MSQPPDNAPRIAIACGGTGGHLFPGLAVARQLAQRGCAVTLLVSPKDVDQQALKAAPEFAAVTLPAVALQRGSRLAFCRGFVRSYFAARQLFRSTPPHAALAMGGFTSVPPVLAARRAGARTFLHESNTVPGRANRLLARWVDAAFLGFPEAAARLKTRRTVLTGTPVRPQFQPQDSAACRRALGLDPHRPVVLVMGGSQGASGVNELLLRALPRLARTAPQWQWLHLTGPNDGDKVRVAYGSVRLTALVHPFLSAMELALGAADVAVTRAGASSLAELAALRLPAVLVPLPTAADNHQHFNAAALEQSGAARRLDQTASPEQLVRVLEELMAPGPARQQMQAALARWHAPNAAADIATQILATLPISQRANLSTDPTVAGAAHPPRRSAHELEVAA